MPSATPCPSCASPLQLPEALRGRPVKCPSCAVVFTAPAPRPDAGLPELELGAPPAPRAARGAIEIDPPPDDRPPPRRTAPEPERTAAPAELGPRRDAEPHRGPMIVTLGACGLVGVILCAPIGLGLSLAAWAMGATDLRRIRARELGAAGEGPTQAGLVCGVVGAILNVVACAVWLFVLFLNMGGGGGRGPTSAPKMMPRPRPVDLRPADLPPDAKPQDVIVLPKDRD